MKEPFIPDFPEAENNSCERVLNVYTVISNRIRFKVLCILREQDYCVNELVKKVQGKNSNVSQQLKILHQAGFISSRREGKFIFYHFEDERLKKLLEYTQDLFADDISR